MLKAEGSIGKSLTDTSVLPPSEQYNNHIKHAIDRSRRNALHRLPTTISG